MKTTETNVEEYPIKYLSLLGLATYVFSVKVDWHYRLYQHDYPADYATNNGEGDDFRTSISIY